MGPVEAQDEVRVPAVQEEVCCPEGDREALDALAEVSGEPEVGDEGIHKDILGTEGEGRKEGEKQAVSLLEIRAGHKLPGRGRQILGEHLGG